MFALYAVNTVAGRIVTSHRPMWLEPVNIRTFGPGRVFELEFGHEQASFFIPKQERPDSGTFTVTRSPGRSLTNIPRPGRFESFYCVPGGSDCRRFMFLIRNERSDELTAVLVEPMGYECLPTRVPDPSLSFPVGRLKDAQIRVWNDRIAALFDGGTKIEYDFSTKVWTKVQ